MHELLMMVAVATVIVGPPSDTQEDLRKLQGQWTIQAIIHDGADGLVKDKATSTWTIKDHKITYRETSSDHEVFQLDASKSPRTMDITSYRGQDADKVTRTLKGIYRLDGVTLTLCIDIDDRGYPPTFESKAGSRFRLITLACVK